MPENRDRYAQQVKDMIEATMPEKDLSELQKMKDEMQEFINSIPKAPNP